MIQKIYYLTRHFIKVNTAYKINFLSILVFPVIGIIYQLDEYIFQSISIEELYRYLSLWLAYMVTITAFTIGHKLVSLREQQFLKQFSFITQNPKVIILSLILSQFITLLGIVSILALGSTFLFKVPFFDLWIFCLGTVIIPFLPLSLLFLVLNLLPIHAENIQPLVTIGTAFMLFYLNFLSVTEPATLFRTLINPMNFALEAGKIWGSAFIPNVIINSQNVLVTGMAYLIIGYFAMRFTRINANFRI